MWSSTNLFFFISNFKYGNFPVGNDDPVKIEYLISVAFILRLNLQSKQPLNSMSLEVN